MNCLLEHAFSQDERVPRSMVIFCTYTQFSFSFKLDLQLEELTVHFCKIIFYNGAIVQFLRKCKRASLLPCLVVFIPSFLAYSNCFFTGCHMLLNYDLFSGRGGGGLHMDFP